MQLSKKSALAYWPLAVVVVAALVLLLAHVRLVDLLIWLLILLAGAHAFRGLRPAQEERDTDEKPDEVPSPVDEEHRLQKWFDLLKLEYEKAADRYDNIYRAIWQNFSYMAVLAGGILTFGGKDLDRALVYFLALTPLTFWFTATFLPMDHYGDETRKRLSSIEDDINRIYFPEPTDPKLQHFKVFKLSKYKWRVQEAVKLFGATVSAVWALMAVLAVHHVVDASTGRGVPASSQAFQLEPQTFHVEVRDPQTAAVRDSLAALSRRVLSIDSLLRLRMNVPHPASRRPAKPK